MLVAFVVSVVAEGARPVTLVFAMTIGIFDANVRRPFESTVKDGEVFEEPYVAATTAVVGRRF